MFWLRNRKIIFKYLYTLLSGDLRTVIKENILREKSLAIYFGDPQFRRNRTFNFIESKIYVDKRSRIR